MIPSVAVDPSPRERAVAGDRRDFLAAPDERRDLVAQRLVQARLDLLLQRHGVGLTRRENHVPAGDEGLDVLQAHSLELPAQLLHRHGMAPDVDGPEKGDKARHGERADVNITREEPT